MAQTGSWQLASGAGPWRREPIRRDQTAQPHCGIPAQCTFLAVLGLVWLLIRIPSLVTLCQRSHCHLGLKAGLLHDRAA